MWEIAAGIVFILFIIYKWVTWNYDYWRKNNVPYIEPSFLFGNVKDLILMKKHAGQVYTDIYWKYPDEPAIGIYRMLSVQLVLRDINLIKTVMVKEFNSFHDNEMEVDPNADIMIARNPFIAKGDEWKSLRTFHSHSLSSGKIKGMFPLMLDVYKDMSQFLKQNQDKPIEAKYFSGQYTTDVVASCVYGLKTNSFLDPSAKFRKVAKQIFERTFYLNLIFIMSTMAPQLFKLLKMRFIPKEVNTFFFKVVEDICEYRKANGVTRNDFVQTMLDENLKSEKPKFTYEEIAAHTMTFFLDGYETSSTLMAYSLYIFGLYPELQEQVRQELNDVGELNYEEIHKLKRLDAFINETLRLYPPGLVLSRLCTKDIVLKSGERSYPITKGMTVAIPVLALHKDPNIFPEPTVFNPDRFYEKQNPPEFLPFGLGPRACIGSRFALTQVKTGLAYLLQNFKVSLRDNDEKLPAIDNSSTFLMPPASGLWVKFEAITK